MNVKDIDFFNNDKKNGKNKVEILNDTKFKKILFDIAIEHNINKDRVISDAKKHLKDIYSSHNKFTDEIFMKTFKYLIDMGFEKQVDLNYEELKILTELMKKGSVAFVSSHKSYLDLLIFFIILGKYELPLPFIFTGDNLNLPILGDIFKNSGTIFIKRKIKNDPVYKAVLKYFISWLVKKKSHFAWAIEGSRSRTGKLMDPKMGILKYLSDEDIKYVPVSIIYDLIPDLGEISIEVQGKNKKPENIDWLIDYFKKICSKNNGKISIRFGEAQINNHTLSDFALNIIRNINKISTITTVSLVCNALLNKISMTDHQLKHTVTNLINIIKNKENKLVDRNMTIGKSVEKALRLLKRENIIRKERTRYIINHNKYFHATYYANLSLHYFYQRSFIELAMLKIKNINDVVLRKKIFWEEITFLKKFFKFEFFYNNTFDSDIKNEIKFMFPDINIFDSCDIDKLLNSQRIIVSPVVLGNCLEAYKIVSEALLKLDTKEDADFLNYCLFLSEELHWLGKIKRIEATSKPFLQNGIKLSKSLKIFPGMVSNDMTISKFSDIITRLSENIDKLLSINLSNKNNDIFEESESTPLTEEILNGEKGPHIGAFFDLDKTLIQGYSIWSFTKNRLMSGKITSTEVMNQFFGLIRYVYDREKFEEMVTISTAGIRNINEQEFINLGKEMYMKDIKIYDEAYELVTAHMSMGHTVCIISAASQYQVEPIAKKLDIDIIECTMLEVQDGKFTGQLLKTCWGEGKATAGKKLASEHNLDLDKTYFYTDSSEDLPLIKIVGKPRPINPDTGLIEISSQQGWPIRNFGDDHESQIENVVRSGLSYSLLIPAALKGFLSDNVYGALNSVADVATSVGGIILNVEGEENMWKTRPAVFIFNHQSYADMIVAIKLTKKDTVAIAKKEIKKFPVFGKILEEAGTIFIDRRNHIKTIDALKPAVDGLKKGISLVIFPEGTRSFDYTLGNFKKGAFHIAMQAGVPIVPVVIKNSRDIMPRGTLTIIPGIINIKVLDPIPTIDWKVEILDDKISEIRNLYLEELGQL